MDRQPVDLVRVPREEKYYAVDDVLGRDAASVFPTEARTPGLGADAVRALLGGDRKFISESELQEIKATTGGAGRVEDGSVAADRPLAQVLQDQKDAKEAKFQEQWRLMKTGKNRPLDEDEMQFLDGVAEAEAARQEAAAAEEAEELRGYHEALARQEAARAAAEAAEEAAAGAGGAAPAMGPALPSLPPPAAKARPAARPKIQVQVRARVVPRPADAPGEAPPEAKRQKAEAAQQAEEEEGGADLLGLLGGYGSDSDS
jgi:hypothetical protein